MKTSADIRSDFLAFFRSKGHAIVPSSSLVPASDPTLLFTNSGMVPFKNMFLGSEKPPAARVADVQRCLRAGGKHNDLDSVGYTARHHTFFEMLGNWSFGDYFKRDAILWAWELLTDVWKLPKERLLVTVYHTDDEAYAIWNEQVGVPAERIVRIGDNKGAPYASDNFWQMADTGPCGPCTEIFYDHGDHIAGGPPGSPDEDGDRFIEIWNLVFMQFDRAADGTLTPLPAPCVDTGMGMERLAAVLQHVHTNYEIDLFQHLIKVASALTSTPDLENKSLRVIADHIRACSFLIVDGVLPSNEGRGYVLRRIIRRALRHGWMLGVRGDFFWKMVEPLVAEMGEAYPELAEKRDRVERALKAEEERFGETLEQGMKLFAEVAARSGDTIPGVDAFRLYDTYGFPVDLTADIARERGLTVDMAGFEKAMDEQRERARAASSFESKGQLPAEVASQLAPTTFLGYDALASDGESVAAIVRGGRRLDSLADGEEGIVLLARTPFYAESGGQVGDTGELVTADGRFVVTDTIKLGGAFHGHVGRWQGRVPLAAGASVDARVDGVRRASIVHNHSATHLLHAALRHVLGEHVTQKGSLVAPDRLRFDFAHFQPVTREELRRIEDLVNAEIRGNASADVAHMSYDAAIESGAMALFGEKYGDEVRVLRMGAFSTELCGGTHVGRTGDIGLFKILSEGGVASGVRRIEAVSGAAAMAHVVDEEARLGAIGELLSASAGDVVDKLRQLLDRQKKLERELDGFKARAASAATADLADHAREVAGIKVVAARVDGLDAKALRDGVDTLKQKLVDCVVLLAAGADGKISLVGGVGGAALGRIKAGDVVAHVASAIGGKGGGRPDMAQGGGNDTPELAGLLAALPEWVGGRLG
ncbi:alanine--tRNA ligase [Dokdonella sp. MW10]|uniref:alanine--tRNA ligase n=1 Tax=Dokdonella sp. MW10 TaxID=2992926 RepID=UPI003F80E7F4